MSWNHFYPFYPKRIFFVGISLLSLAFCAGLFFLIFSLDQEDRLELFVDQKATIKKEQAPLSLTLHLKEGSFAFSVPQIAPQLSFFFSPLRPNNEMIRFDSEPVDRRMIYLQLNRTGKLHRITLPCRVHLLLLQGGEVELASDPSSFWLDLTAINQSKLQGIVSIQNERNEIIEGEIFNAPIKLRPLKSSQEFLEGSFFHHLSEARWLGRDLFLEKYESRQVFRLAVSGLLNDAIGGQVIDLEPKGWLIWKDRCWINDSLDPMNSPAARIESISSHALILEGWDGEIYSRISLPLNPSVPFKAKGEDIFNAIRVRSKQQISCIMDKQCMILRSGDWVLKSGGKWKALRKKEDREAFKTGKMVGELFVFDKMENIKGQDSLLGSIFSADRTQMVPIKLPVNKKNLKKESKEIVKK